MIGIAGAPLYRASLVGEARRGHKKAPPSLRPAAPFFVFGPALCRREVDRGSPSLLAALKLVAELLAFVEVAHPGPLDGRDMDEHVLRAVVGLDEAVALLGVEPLYGSGSNSKPFVRTNRRPP